MFYGQIWYFLTILGVKWKKVLCNLLNRRAQLWGVDLWCEWVMDHFVCQKLAECGQGEKIEVTFNGTYLLHKSSISGCCMMDCKLLHKQCRTTTTFLNILIFAFLFSQGKHDKLFSKVEVLAWVLSCMYPFIMFTEKSEIILLC